MELRAARRPITVAGLTIDLTAEFRGPMTTGFNELDHPKVTNGFQDAF
jgi:hypothetical protein